MMDNRRDSQSGTRARSGRRNTCRVDSDLLALLLQDPRLYNTDQLPSPSLAVSKLESRTHLAGKVSDVQRYELSSSLVTVPNILKGLGCVLAGFLDEDFVTTWVLSRRGEKVRISSSSVNMEAKRWRRVMRYGESLTSRDWQGALFLEMPSKQDLKCSRAVMPGCPPECSDTWDPI